VYWCADDTLYKWNGTQITSFTSSAGNRVRGFCINKDASRVYYGISGENSIKYVDGSLQNETIFAEGGPTFLGNDDFKIQIGTDNSLWLILISSGSGVIRYLNGEWYKYGVSYDSSAGVIIGGFAYVASYFNTQRILKYTLGLGGTTFTFIYDAGSTINDMAITAGGDILISLPNELRIIDTEGNLKYQSATFTNTKNSLSTLENNKYLVSDVDGFYLYSEDLQNFEKIVDGISSSLVNCDCGGQTQKNFTGT
jgi:hypothetical protein